MIPGVSDRFPGGGAPRRETPPQGYPGRSYRLSPGDRFRAFPPHRRVGRGQIHGGYGYMMDNPIQMYYRDCKLGEIGEGTSQIQLNTIARMLGL